MVNSAHTSYEQARLSALQSYAILDTGPEEAFDNLAALAARLCNCPMAVVNFLDSERQWFKAAVGMPFEETDRVLAFCAHAIDGRRDPMVVTDASQHPVFATNPFVVHEPCVRFYACVPLVTASGHAIGTLAVLHTVPRTMDAQQLLGLQTLAEQVMAQLELRRQKSALVALLQERDAMNTELAAQSETLRSVADIAGVGGWTVELPSLQLTWS